MASYIKILKDERENIIYPQTLASAVVTTGGSDAQTILDGCIKAVDLTSMPSFTPPVTTNMIANNAVTPAKMSTSTYSTSEQVVGTWIDGKTIYRKVITKTISGIPVSDNTFAHNVANFDDLVEMRVLFNLGWSTARWASEGYLSNRGCTFSMDTTNIHYENSNSAIANWTGTLVFIIEYTKSS